MRTWVLSTAMTALLAAGGLLFADPGEEPAADGRQAQSSAAAAKQESVRASRKEGKKNNKTPMAVTPEREAAVRTFIERNHPELAGLLAHLKDNQPREYERAVRELHRVTERLAGVQERDALQYELEVRLWTAQSQVQLLAARLKMGQTEELKDQLRQAIGQQADAKVELLRHDRSRVAERLSRIDRDIARFEAGRDEIIEKQLELLTRASSQEKPAQPGTKAAANKPADSKAATSKPASSKAAAKRNRATTSAD